MKRKKSSQTEKRPLVDTASDVTRSVRFAPPAHYSFKIESFSGLVEMLSMTGDEKYESCDFEVGGVKWKLALYPNGYKKGKRKTNAVNDHLSLYLVLSETNNQPSGSGVSAFFRLSIYDQIRENYLTVQDATQKIVRFHGTNAESGFAQFIPLTTFHDALKGYLVDDCCIFGADVFVTNCTGKRENLSVTNEPQEGFFYWKITDYSKLREDHLVSNHFTVQGRDWYLSIYPRGESPSNNEFLALYLHLHSDSGLSPGQKMYCEYKLRLRDQLKGRHHERTGGTWFAYPTDSPGQRLGYQHFVPLSNLTDKSRGFLVKGTLIIEAQITFISLVSSYS